jgi:hypothetical protein
MVQPQVDMADEEAGIIQMGNVVEPSIRKRSADQIEQPQIHNLFNMRDICVLKDNVNEELVTRFYNQTLQPHYSATWDQIILPDTLSRIRLRLQNKLLWHVRTYRIYRVSRNPYYGQPFTESGISPDTGSRLPYAPSQDPTHMTG